MARHRYILKTHQKPRLPTLWKFPPIAHSKNILYCVAKRNVVFNSKEETEEVRLMELRELLQQCDYPPKLINEGIRNARLQGLL